MQDHATLIRQVMIAALKDDGEVAGQVEDRVYDEVVASPVWDFIRIAPPELTLYESSCGEGFEGEWRIHIFGRGPGTKGVNALFTKVFHVLCETELPFPTLSRFDLDFVRSSTGPDGAETSNYHTNMVVRTVSVE